MVGASPQGKLRFVSPLRNLHFCLYEEGVVVERRHPEVSGKYHFLLWLCWKGKRGLGWGCLCERRRGVV